MDETLESSGRSRRPKDSRFFQQTLPAWHPMLSLRKSALMFLILAVFFIPIGIVSIVTSNRVTEYFWDYSDCLDSVSNRVCADMVNSATPCVCKKFIQLNSQLPKPVFFYYGLKNFHQNHRRFEMSKSDKQLLGERVSVSDLSSCSPFSSINNGTHDLPILPCGSIANSIFNDTFKIRFFPLNLVAQDVPMTSKGIAWKTDVSRTYGLLKPEALADTVKPPSWPDPITARSRTPFKSDEELMVWMKPAALPTFRKLHRRIIHEGTFADGLPVGSYEIEVTYKYPVKSFNGRKFVVLANTSWLGGKNLSIGITCIVAGSAHVLLSILFLVLHPYAQKVYTFLYRIHPEHLKAKLGEKKAYPSGELTRTEL